MACMTPQLDSSTLWSITDYTVYERLAQRHNVKLNSR